MAKARNKLADFLSRLGSKIFTALTRWEDNGIVPRTSHWLKPGILGFLVVLIGSLTAQPEEYHVMCYDMAVLPNAYVTEISADPNPTAGADSVTVRARATVSEELIEGSYISGANIQIDSDTTFIPMLAADGKFDGTDEKLEGRISVAGLEPGIIWVYVSATTSQGGVETQGVQLVITEPDTTENEEKPKE